MSLSAGTLVWVSSPTAPRAGQRVPARTPRGLPQVQLTVSPLPALGEEDELLCLFGDSPLRSARVEGDTVTCDPPSSIPSTPPGQGEALPSGHRLALVPSPCAWGGHCARPLSPPVPPFRTTC